MAETMYTFEARLGRIELPRPLGQWVQDDDGGWWEMHTPTRHFDHFGRLEREEPYEPMIKMFDIDPRYLPGVVVRQRRVSAPWWKFWDRRDG